MVSEELLSQDIAMLHNE